MTTSSPSTTPEWDLIIQPQRNLLDFRLGELWRYRDLVMLFVRRDFVAAYKQTILGPLWYLIQPLLTTVTFTFMEKGEEVSALVTRLGMSEAESRQWNGLESPLAEGGRWIGGIVREKIREYLQVY